MLTFAFCFENRIELDWHKAGKIFFFFFHCEQFFVYIHFFLKIWFFCKQLCNFSISMLCIVCCTAYNFFPFAIICNYFARIFEQKHEFWIRGPTNSTQFCAHHVCIPTFAPIFQSYNYSTWFPKNYHIISWRKCNAFFMKKLPQKSDNKPLLWTSYMMANIDPLGAQHISWIGARFQELLISTVHVFEISSNPHPIIIPEKKNLILNTQKHPKNGIYCTILVSRQEFPWKWIPCNAHNGIRMDLQSLVHSYAKFCGEFFAIFR